MAKKLITKKELAAEQAAHPGEMADAGKGELPVGERRHNGIDFRLGIV